jgi:hypothetical protein
MLEPLWWVVTFPFRLVGIVVAVLGRAVALVLGFVLMVAGFAFCAGSWLPLGIPLFIIGLLFTLKAIG